MQLSPAQHKVAGEYVDLIANKLGSGRAVHSETAIAGAGRLAGSLLFRSFELNVDNVAPGTVVLSVEANEQGIELINILAALLQHFGVSLEKIRSDPGSTNRGKPPELTVVQSLQLCQDDALRVAADNGLKLKEAAHAAAMATAFIVKECAPSVGVGVAFRLATFSFIEGTKTMPPAIGAKLAPQPARSRPWYKFW